MTVEKKKILPLGNADINVYPIYSNPLSVLSLHEEVQGWLLCNFIQLASNGKALLFYDFNYKMCPYLKIQRISRDYLTKLKIDILDFIIQNISYGCYAYLMVRRSDISAYVYMSIADRGKDDSVHDIFIYGYDTMKKILYISDNFEYGKYSQEVCTFEEFRTAFENVSPKYESSLGFMGNIELWQYYGRDIKSFNLKRVQDSLKDYIRSKATTEWNTMDCRDNYADPKLVFGLECYGYLEHRVMDAQLGNAYIQDFHLLWEHKKHIKKICLYLLEHEIINDAGFLDALEDVCNRALIIRNLMVKYMISGENHIKVKTISKLSELAQIEKCALEQMLKNIQDCQT